MYSKVLMADTSLVRLSFGIVQFFYCSFITFLFGCPWQPFSLSSTHWNIRRSRVEQTLFYWRRFFITCWEKRIVKLLYRFMGFLLNIRAVRLASSFFWHFWCYMELSVNWSASICQFGKLPDWLEKFSKKTDQPNAISISFVRLSWQLASDFQWDRLSFKVA